MLINRNVIIALVFISSLFFLFPCYSTENNTSTLTEEIEPLNLPSTWKLNFKDEDDKGNFSQVFIPQQESEPDVTQRISLTAITAPMPNMSFDYYLSFLQKKFSTFGKTKIIQTGKNIVGNDDTEQALLGYTLKGGNKTFIGVMLVSQNSPLFFTTGYEKLVPNKDSAAQESEQNKIAQMLRCLNSTSAECAKFQASNNTDTKVHSHYCACGKVTTSCFTIVGNMITSVNWPDKSMQALYCRHNAPPLSNDNSDTSDDESNDTEEEKE